MTRRLWLLSGLIYLLFFFGFIFRRGELFALGLLPLTLVLAAIASNREGSSSLTAERILSADRILTGAPVVVNVKLENKGNTACRLRLVEPAVKLFEKVEGETAAFADLMPGQSVEIHYEASGKRGYIRFPPLEVTLEDPLGLFEQKREVAAPASVMILPEMTRLRAVTIQPMRTQIYSGMIPARMGGSGINFYGVRPYRQGDPQRWINWKKTARYEESFFINEYEQERIADIGLVLDARQMLDVTGPQDALFEHSIRATASLADTFLRYGNRVGMMIYGRGAEPTFPGYGKLQRERIFRALAHAQTGDNLVLVNLGYLPTRFFPPKSQIVLISPMMTDDVPVLVRLCANGYRVMVISPDPAAYEASFFPQGEEREIAYRVARLERALLVHKVRGIGIPVIDWDVQLPLDQAIYSGLGRLPWLPSRGALG